MVALYGELSPTIDQFIIRWVKDELLVERVVRLDNGFPTTAREKKVYDERQEELLQKLAKVKPLLNVFNFSRRPALPLEKKERKGFLPMQFVQNVIADKSTRNVVEELFSINDCNSTCT
jgi:hypothetical protein